MSRSGLHVTINSASFEPAYLKQVLDQAIGRCGFSIETSDVLTSNVGATLFVSEMIPESPGQVVLIGHSPSGGDFLSSIVSPRSENDAVSSELADYLTRAYTRLGRMGLGSDWQRSSEELIRLVSLLLDDREGLLQALRSAYEDGRTAEARVTLLESQLAALQAERLDTSESFRSPLVIATLALVVATILGPLVATVVSNPTAPAIQSVVRQAQVVQNECNLQVTVTGDPTATTVRRKPTGP